MNWLKIICDENGITIFKLAELIGEHHQQLYKINNRYIDDLKLDYVGKFSRALNMSEMEFVENYYHRFTRNKESQKD